MGEEEEDGPGKDPEEGQVEHPADPRGGSPLVDLSWGIDSQAVVRSGKGDVEVPAIVRLGDGRSEELLQSLGIVVRDLTFQGERSHARRVCDK